MSADAKRSMSSTIVLIVLIVLGMPALYGGTRWLGLLIPAAALIWYGVGPIGNSGRN